MDTIYEVALILFRVLFGLISPFNKKIKQWIKGRKDLFKQIEDELKNDKFRIWIHVASLGEFEQGRPIIELLKKKYPKYKIVLTFFSPSGYEIQKNYRYVDYVFYLPLDTKRNATKFIKLINPNIAIFVKYEFWYNHLKALQNHNIPILLISGIFRANQTFFKWYGKWYKRMLYKFSYFFVQNKESKKLLEHIGIHHVSIAGDTRFDRVIDIASKTKPIPIIENFCNNNISVIFGSSWKADEDLFFEFINKENKGVKFIIAPHEIHESNIKRIESNITKPTQRYSKINDNYEYNDDVLIIDNIGMLSSIYQYGSIAYIGGGFGSGIHNILEAATFGLPVMFGPNYYKFQEAVDLIKLKGAFEIKNKVEAELTLRKLIDNKQVYDETALICKNYVENKKGASSMIIDYIVKKYLQ